jgi:hypothetical protein
LNEPFALTQFALMFTYVLRSRTSSTERSPISSTFTRLPLRPRLFDTVEVDTARGGSLVVIGRFIAGKTRSSCAIRRMNLKDEYRSDSDVSAADSGIN